MYRLAVTRDFVAQHYLIGGDWGTENFKHSHSYKVEVLLRGKVLNQHGYLVDIVELESALNEIIARSATAPSTTWRLSPGSTRAWSDSPRSSMKSSSPGWLRRICRSP